MRCSLKLENKLRAIGHCLIAGIDEAGRGPLAGPVVAAAVILPPRFRHPILRDSKQLSEKQRESLHSELTARADILWNVQTVSPEEIDRINILRATHQAMRLAATSLPQPPDHVLIDGLPVPHFPLPHTAVVRGDQSSYSIAAASILAKVTRDRIMVEMDRLHPGYEFARHKGYGTALHLQRLELHGPCPIHRRTFLPVRQSFFSFAEQPSA